MQVALYTTCLAEHFSPKTLEAVIKVLKTLGVRVEIPAGQTCCGQPAYNAGFFDKTKSAAKRVLKMIQKMKSEFLIVPSGSCTFMIRDNYKKLFPDADLNDLKRVYEFTEFITDVLKITEIPGAKYEGTVAYHDSCHLVRGCNISEGPRTLLRAVKGLKLITLDEEKQCCGFGGVFSVKHPEISTKLAENKIKLLEKTDADTLTAGDLGCLLNMGGLISRRNLPYKVMHYAEILASE